MSEILILTPVLHGPHNSADAPDGQIHCSVHVGVRLTPETTIPGVDATLAAFPTMIDWPANIPELAIQIGARLPIKAKMPSIAASSLWKQVFPASKLVYPYKPPPALPDQSNGIWFDALEMTSRVQEHYKSAAQNPIQPSKATLLKPRPGLLKPDPLVSSTGPFKAMEFIGAAPPADPVMEATKNFFAGATNSKTNSTKIPQPSAPPPPPDFHDLLGYLHQTPAALRALGLIFEIVAPWPEGADTAPIESITLQVLSRGRTRGTGPDPAAPEFWTPTVQFPKPLLALTALKIWPVYRKFLSIRCTPPMSTPATLAKTFMRCAVAVSRWCAFQRRIRRASLSQRICRACGPR